MEDFGNLRLKSRRKLIMDKLRLAKWHRKEEKKKQPKRHTGSEDDEEEATKHTRKRRRTRIYKD